MTVEQLIGSLNILLEHKKIFKDTTVDINHGNGLYDSVDNVDVQEWVDRDQLKHRVVTLFTKQYNQKESIL